MRRGIQGHCLLEGKKGPFQLNQKIFCEKQTVKIEQVKRPGLKIDTLLEEASPLFACTLCTLVFSVVHIGGVTANRMSTFHMSRFLRCKKRLIIDT